MKFLGYVAAALLVISPLASKARAASAVDKPSADGGTVSQFNVGDDTQVPGKLLKKGAYTIRVVDHLSDRMIVRVDKNGKTESVFLALPKSTLPSSSAGPITLGSGVNGKAAFRGYSFPDGTVAEFVYPKGEAVDLAKANDTKIPAIDPASEGRVASPSLSKEDMQMVTLWMLSPTAVGPDSTGPGIKAERYQQVASAKVPPRPKAKPVMAALPHTAGNTPLMYLTGLLSLGAAGLMARRRFAAEQV